MTGSVLGPDAHGVALVGALAETHQTPFYVYDTAIYGARAQALRAALPAGSHLLYSVKANPHGCLLTTAFAAGCGLEIASPGELDRLTEVGLNPARALLVGPAKSDTLLESALMAGVGTLVVESLRELHRLQAVAARVGCRDVAVALRLSLEGAKGSLRMSGHQFGMERAEALECHSALAASKRLRFAGYHGYLASQLLDAADIAHNTELVLREVEALTSEVGVRPQVIDVGGGFGIPYTSSQSPLSLVDLAARLGRLAERAERDSFQLVFESGRFLAGPAGALVCRVIDTKVIASRRYVLLDGGMNSSGIFGGSNSMRSLSHHVLRDGQLVHGGPASNLCGPLCTPMDRLATSVPCSAEVGDLVVWWNMGAYGLTAAPTAFLSFPRLHEVFVESETGSPAGSASKTSSKSDARIDVKWRR